MSSADFERNAKAPWYRLCVSTMCRTGRPFNHAKAIATLRKNTICSGGMEARKKEGGDGKLEHASHATMIRSNKLFKLLPAEVGEARLSKFNSLRVERC